MEVFLIPSSPGAKARAQYLTSFVVDGHVAIDAGSLGLFGTPADQGDIGHVFLTHSHADHVATLPIFLENRWAPTRPPASIYGNRSALESLRTDVFNDRVWPDLLRLAPLGKPFFELHELEEEETVSIGGLSVTPVSVDHVVPTFGYVVERDGVAIVFGADSGPTDRIWEVARSRNVRAAFIESSFPNRMKEFASLTKHLTPQGVFEEMEKLPSHTEVLAVHIKTRYRDEVEAELRALESDRLSLGEAERIYRF